MRAAAIGLYIASPIPLFIFSELDNSTLGLCMTLLLVAAATVLIILGKRQEQDEGDIPHARQEAPSSPRQELNKSIQSLIGVVTLVLYLLLSFTTGAWFITWLVFPIASAVRGLIKAILDLKEAVEHEN